MLNSYYTEKLLGLQEVSIKKVNDTKENYEIFIEQPRKQCVCPVCGKLTDEGPRLPYATHQGAFRLRKACRPCFAQTPVRLLMW